MQEIQKAINCKFSFSASEKKVIWEITNTCNYACSYCIFASNGRVNPHELSLEKIIKTINELKDQGFNYIKFTGGEPFLRKDLFSILTHCDNVAVRYDISTNASLISKTYLKELNKLANLNFLHVSLDGFDKHSHESVRGLKTWEPTLKGITLLKNSNFKKRVGCVLHRENFNQIDKLVELLVENKINIVAFSLMEPAGRMQKDDPRILTKGQVATAIALISKLKERYSDIEIVSNLSTQEYKVNSCAGGTSFLFIDNIGSVSPCTWVSQKDFSYLTHSLQNKSLVEILNGPAFSKFKSIAEKSLICPAQNNVSNIVELKFQKFYIFSNENLKQLPTFKNKEIVATTGSSADQALCFLLNGASHVKLLDINPKAKFFLDLKIAAIGAFSLDQYISFFSSSMDYIRYKKLRLKLPADSQKYWDTEYLLNNYDCLINTEIFNKSLPVIKREFISYLNEKSYRLLQSMPIEKLISVHNVDLMTSSSLSSIGPADLLYASNIPDYSHKYFKNSLDYSQKMFEIIQNWLTVAKKVVFYLYDVENINNSDKRNVLNDQKTREMLVKKNNLNLKEVVFSSIFEKNQKDALCIMTKKD